MKNFLRNLRIGEKIGLSFGFVGLLFLGVIWQYHATLNQSNSDYLRLQNVFEARKSHAFRIGHYMAEARRAEKSFLLEREHEYVKMVKEKAEQALEHVSRLAEIDRDNYDTWQRMALLIRTYQQTFISIVDAWERKGLDHNSGLQGRFRTTVHELEKLAENYKVDQLYLLLLQIRRREKDLGLRREHQYHAQVLFLIDKFKETVNNSNLNNVLEDQLVRKIESYRVSINIYAQSALKQESIHGGRGPFRKISHDIEDLLKAHHVPDLGKDLLQLRRREKDYLLRNDRQYVSMVQQEIALIRTKLDIAGIASEDKQKLIDLLNSYEDDFIGLVKQNTYISKLTNEMRIAVEQIMPLVDRNLERANQVMSESAQAINAKARSNARAMLWVALSASLLGVFFSVLITRKIVRPIGRIVTALSQLAHGDPPERISSPEGRDEVCVMAKAVDTMIDHTERLIAWSIASLKENESHLRTVVDPIIPGIFVTDSNGDIQALNAVVAQIFGYDVDDIIKKPVKQIIPNFPIQNYQVHVSIGHPPAISSEVDTRIELMGIKKDGEQVPLWLIVNEIELGSRRMLIGLVIDITTRKEAETTLREAIDHKSELQTIMSHEIRTLLNDIIQSAEKLPQLRHPKEKRRYVEVINEKGQSIMDILDVILGYFHFKTDKLRLEEKEFDLQGILEPLTNYFSEYADKKGITYQMHLSSRLPRLVFGDGGHLRHVLVNLLSNAVKFTKQGKVTLTVELDSSTENDNQILFNIKDTGIGIGKEQLAHIFEPPMLGKESSFRKYRMAHQGLAVTLKLVRLMGGTIEVESELNVGSTFSVRLPLNRR
jgi:PAS domain S-box-containing protein